MVHRSVSTHALVFEGWCDGRLEAGCYERDLGGLAETL